RSVSALTGKQDQRSRGSSLLAAASKARAMVVYLGPFPTATEDRELVAQHNDLELPLITWRTSRPRGPQRSRYSKDISTTRSQNLLRLYHQHGRPGQILFLYPTRCGRARR